MQAPIVDGSHEDMTSRQQCNIVVSEDGGAYSSFNTRRITIVTMGDHGYGVQQEELLQIAVSLVGGQVNLLVVFGEGDWIAGFRCGRAVNFSHTGIIHSQNFVASIFGRAGG